MKKCPFCAEMIKSEAKVCRFCGREQNPNSEPVAETPRPPTEPRQEKKATLAWNCICGEINIASAEMCRACGDRKQIANTAGEMTMDAPDEYPSGSEFTCEHCGQDALLEERGKKAGKYACPFCDEMSGLSRPSKSR
jgi:hypothetical protein